MKFPINSINELDKISHAAKWQFFERLAGFIFEENGFDAKQNVVVKNNLFKRQFDVIAKRYRLTFLVECKKWKSRKQRTGAMKSAVSKHLERCALYEELFGAGIPLIVTLLEEEIMEHENVFIVPISKLNWFINNYDTI